MTGSNIILVFLVIATSTMAQNEPNSLVADIETNQTVLRKPLTLEIKKTGVYFGYARGKMNSFEIGAARQFKKLRFKHPKTHEVHLGINYNFANNLMGYEAGYWYRGGRFQLTYGGDIVVRTNFDHTRFGIGPALGYKLLGFHLQTGYHFLTNDDIYLSTNTFFIRLRFIIINDVDIKLRRKK